MSEVQTVVDLISKMGDSDLKTVQAAFNSRVRKLTEAKLFRFRIGDTVSFTAKGRHYTGKVEKINRKTVTVAISPTQSWRVSPGFLKKAA